MKRARAVLYWAGLPIGGKCKYLLAPETCLLHRDPCFCKRSMVRINHHDEGSLI